MKTSIKSDKVRRTLQANKGEWFDLSYRVKMNEDETFDYENVVLIKSSNNTSQEKKEASK